MNSMPDVFPYTDSMLTVEHVKECCDGKKPVRILIPWDVMHEPDSPNWKEFNIELLPSKAGNPDPVSRTSPFDYATILFGDGTVSLIVCRRCPPMEVFESATYCDNNS